MSENPKQTQPRDIEEELQGEPSPLEVKKSPMAEDIKAFMEGAGQEVETEKEEDEEPLNIPANDAEFSEMNPYDKALSESLIDVTNVTVTDEDRETYLRAIMHDKPWELSVMLYDGALEVRLRARRTYTQGRVFEIVKYQEVHGLIDRDDVAMIMDRIQRYSALVMVVRVNDKDWPCINFKSPEVDYHGASDQSREDLLAEDSKLMYQYWLEYCSQMPTPKWTAIQNAMRIFETKQALLASEAAKGVF